MCFTLCATINMEDSPLREVNTTGVVKKEKTASPSPPVLSDFSIEHILRSAGTRRCKDSSSAQETAPAEDAKITETSVAGNIPTPIEQHQMTRFEWLQCTRYHPPKLPRSRRKESCPKDGGAGKPQSQQPQQRRKLGRNPRIPFSSSQVSALEQRFRRGHYLSSADVAALSSCLRLSETRVKIWFQNRRARERRDREARATKSSENAAMPQENTDTITHFVSTPVVRALPCITDTHVLEQRLRPSTSPINGSTSHMFTFHSPGLLSVTGHPSTISFPRDIDGSQGLPSAFMPISPHSLTQSHSLIGASPIPRTFLPAQHKTMTKSTV